VSQIVAAATEVTTTVATKPLREKTMTDGPVKLNASASRDASYPALVITDQRRKKVGLTEAIGSGIGAWWNDQLNRVSTKKKAPAYVAPAAPLDKGRTNVRSARDTVSSQNEVIAKLRAAEKSPIKATPKSPAPTAPTITDAAPAWDTGHTIALETEAIMATTSDAPTTSVSTGEVVASHNTTEDDNINVPLITPIIPTLPVMVDTANDIEQDSADSREYEPAAEIAVNMEDTDDNDADEPFVLFAHDTPESTPDELVTSISEPLVPSPVSRPRITPAIPVVSSDESAAAITPLITERPSIVAQLRQEELSTLQNPSRGLPEDRQQQLRLAQEAAALPVPERTSTFSRFWPYMVAGMFVCVTAGTILFYMVQNSSETPTVIQDTELPTTTNLTDLPNGPSVATMNVRLDAPNRNSLYSVIMDANGSGESLFIVTPLAHDTGLALRPSEVISLMNRALPADFTGNITAIRLGKYRDNPVIILNIVDETRIRGGLFRWEESLSNDLNPWFGTPIKTSQASLSFTDGIVDSYDVRTLKDDLGNERITYGFVNSGTVIITNTKDSFLNIAASIPSY
jgi:hypothetical protein